MNANVDFTLIVYSGQMLLLKLLTASLHEELAREHITGNLSLVSKLTLKQTNTLLFS